MFIPRSTRFALALLVVSGAPVLAQQTPFFCNASTANPTAARAYGLTELVGDVMIVCTGVPPLPAGAAIPQFNLTVSIPNAPITSRILDPQTGATEARLLVNEPGSGWASSMVNGFGPSAPQILCPTALTGCAQQIAYAQVPPVGLVPVPVLPGVSTPPPIQDVPNVYQGVLTGVNQLTFYGIPLVPSSLLAAGPGWTGVVFRITNIRVNVAAAAPPGWFQGQPAVMAAISASLPVAVQNPMQTVAHLFTAFESTNASLNFVPCASGRICPLAMLRFSEAFASAAKTRFAEPDDAAPQHPQNVPGTFYAGSESGFFDLSMTGANPAAATAGLADFGTRLKAVIRTPPGVRVWVATGLTWSGAGPYLNAALTRTEAGAFSGVPHDIVVDGRPAAELPIVNGTAIAVWEVLFANPSERDTFEFPLFVSYPGGMPPPMPMTIRGSVAPTFDEGAIPPDGVFAHGPDYAIPRFLRPPAILLPTSITVAPEQFTAVPLTLPGPAGPNGVAIALASSDPWVATVMPTAAVLPGEVSPDRRPPLVNGIHFGRALLTVSAPGFESATVAVTVTLDVRFSTPAVIVPWASRQARPLLALSAPAPSGGLSVAVSSDNPGVASVPGSVFVEAGALSVAIPVTASGLGSTMIRARVNTLSPEAILLVGVIP